MSHSLFISLSRHTALEKNRPLLPPSNLPGVVFAMLSFIRRGSVLTETKAGGLPMQQRRGLFVQFRMLRFTSKQNKKPAATGHSHGRAMHALVSLLVIRILHTHYTLPTYENTMCTVIVHRAT